MVLESFVTYIVLQISDLIMDIDTRRARENFVKIMSEPNIEYV